MTITPKNDLVKIQVQTAGQAVELIGKAHDRGLHASYHPNGGDTIVAERPVTHIVYVMGEGAARFSEEWKNAHE